MGAFAGNVPIVGPYLRVAMEKIGGVAAAASGGGGSGGRGSELPV